MKSIPMAQFIGCIGTIICELTLLISYNPDCGTNLSDCPNVAGVIFAAFDWLCTVAIGFGYAVRLYSLLQNDFYKRLSMSLFIVPVLYGNLKFKSRIG